MKLILDKRLVMALAFTLIAGAVNAATVAWRKTRSMWISWSVSSKW